jgi:hypothetical protein
MNAQNSQLQATSIIHGGAKNKTDCLTGTTQASKTFELWQLKELSFFLYFFSPPLSHGSS